MAVFALPLWAVYSFYAVSAVSTVATAAQAIKSGKQAKEGFKARAHQEKMSAQEDSNIRREKLLKAMSAASASGGASGVSGFSPSMVQLEGVKEFEKEDFSAKVMGKAKQSSLLSQGSSAAKAGKYRAAGSLVGGLTPIAKELS